MMTVRRAGRGSAAPPACCALSVYVLAMLLLLVACGKGKPLGETYLEVSQEAHAELAKTRVAFHTTSTAYDQALNAKRITAEEYQVWRRFFLGEYRPEMDGALQALNAAQNRAQVALTIPRFRALTTKLDGLKARLDSILARGKGPS